MNKKIKFKLYTHHKSFLTLKGKSNPWFVKFLARTANFIYNIFYFTGAGLLGILKFISNKLLSFCYAAGSLVITPFIKILRAFKLDFNNTIKSLPARFKLLSQAKFAKTLLLFLAISAIGYGGIASLRLVAKGLGIKNDVLQTAALGNNYLSEAKNALAAQDFSAADNRFALAFKTFDQGQEELASSGKLLNQLTSLLPQKQTAQNLLTAASLISSGGRDFISLQSDLKTLRMSAAGISSETGSASETLQNIDARVTQISAKVSAANNIVGKIDQGSLPAANRAAFSDLKGQLQTGQFALENFISVFKLAKNLLLGDKNVLILFENNNELRAGGGFIGTFGNLKIHDGQISKINVSSIYDLDNQLAENIQPPTPVLKVSSYWAMRDSNWFADFPLSAKTVGSFYEMEGGDTPDLVVAMTPNLIADLLKITGPINLPRYGVTLTSDNFVEVTQAVTTMSNDLPTNSPKQILADLVPVLLQKISESPAPLFSQIIQTLQNNLNNKQIVLYSRDRDLQSELASFHWTGSVTDTDRDYFSLVSSNLGATKTDLFIDQKVNLTTTVQDDGSIINQVQITRTNKMPNLPDGFNNSFLRIYAPLGSKLISNLGFDFNTLDYSPLEKYKINGDVDVWEKNLVKDVVSGTYIGQESGKTFFGNWVGLNGGETKTVTLVYQLPFKLNDIDKYSLLLQKQIGSLNSGFNWTFNFAGRQIIWKNFDAQKLNTDNLNSDIILDKDYFLGLVMSKR